MSQICPACGYENEPDNDFCEACGYELTDSSAVSPSPTPDRAEETFLPEPEGFTNVPANVPANVPVDVLPEETFLPEPSIDPAFSSVSPEPIPSYPPAPPVTNTSIAAATVKLICLGNGAPVPEFAIDGSSAIIGRFDPDMGPVEIDLEEFPGQDTVSRHHAEIYDENGQWMIKDLGSTNHVFIKRAGQSRFGAMITTPEPLYPGDEVAIGKIRFGFQTA